MLEELLESYKTEEMHWAALLLSEFLLKTNSSPNTYFKLLHSLYHLSFYERIIEIIKHNKELLMYHEIRMLYYRSLSKIENEILPISDQEFTETQVLDTKSKNILQIKKQSIEMTWAGLVKKETDRRDALLSAFSLDEMNLEALYFLKVEKLINKQEFTKLIENIENKTLQGAYVSIFYEKEIGFNFYDCKIFNPHYSEILSKKLVKNGKRCDIFNLSLFMVKNYPRSEYTYLCLGFYYFCVSNFLESKRCFYESVKYNKSGKAWLYLGRAYSGLKECENAVSCFSASQKLMIGSYKPMMYLAFEYHKMNNFDQASHFYKQAIKIKKTKSLIQKYAAFLIFYENYNEALELLINLKERTPETNLLEVYCYLFLGNLKQAEFLIKDLENDWKYFATLGFINHLKNEIEMAVKSYNQALLLVGKSSAIEDLLTLAIDNLGNKQENIVYDFANDLFESLDLKNSKCVEL